MAPPRLPALTRPKILIRQYRREVSGQEGVSGGETGQGGEDRVVVVVVGRVLLGCVGPGAVLGIYTSSTT